MPLLTVAPLVMFNVPLPEEPTVRPPLLVHVEPTPSTVAVPVEVALLPKQAPAEMMARPPLTVTLPTPVFPM
jgi:hypothetical protein